MGLQTSEKFTGLFVLEHYLKDKSLEKKEFFFMNWGSNTHLIIRGIEYNYKQICSTHLSSYNHHLSVAHKIRKED